MFTCGGGSAEDGLGHVAPNIKLNGLSHTVFSNRRPRVLCMRAKGVSENSHKPLEPKSDRERSVRFSSNAHTYLCVVNSLVSKFSRTQWTPPRAFATCDSARFFSESARFSKGRGGRRDFESSLRSARPLSGGHMGTSEQVTKRCAAPLVSEPNASCEAAHYE